MAGPVPLLVSFTIHPLQGSEAGVGWAFLTALLASTLDGTPVHLLLDARDEAAVRAGLAAAGRTDRVVLHPVAVPAPLLRRYGDARTRQSYLGWLPVARARMARIARAVELGTVHQVTFASAVLPPVIGPRTPGRRVWGPLAVPSRATDGRTRPAGARGRAAVRAAQAIAARNLRAADLVVANNAHTAAFVAGLGRSVVVEPNIVAERRGRAAALDDDRLVMSGHLVDRKRPWLAVEALADRRLAGLRLDVLGDGPLLGDLRGLAEARGVSSRVRFLGSLPREQAVESTAGARLLVHPSAREGSPWVVGEAAAAGVAAVVMAGSGAESTVELSANGGVVAEPAVAGTEPRVLADAILAALERPRPEPSDRWSAARLPSLLDAWYRG